MRDKVNCVPQYDLVYLLGVTLLFNSGCRRNTSAIPDITSSTRKTRMMNPSTPPTILTELETFDSANAEALELDVTDLSVKITLTILLYCCDMSAGHFGCIMWVNC